MNLSAIQFHYFDILKDEYDFVDVTSVRTLPGGYLEEETWLIDLESTNRYVIKTIHYSFNVNHLKTILNFQNYLHSNMNYPCPLIISTVKSELFVQIDNDHYVFVQTFVDGHTPSSLELDEYYMMKMGSLLGQLRLASRNFLSTSSPLASNVSRRELIDSSWWTEQVDRLSLCKYLQTIDIECRQKIDQTSELLELGLIHNDFQPSNTLYNTDNGQISIIDFGDACYAPCIVDLATSLFLLLTNGVESKEQLHKFLVSYQQSVQLDQHEIDLLDTLVRLKLTTNFIGDCEDIKSQEEYDQSAWLQSCFRWIHLLREDERDLFRAILTES